MVSKVFSKRLFKKDLEEFAVFLAESSTVERLTELNGEPDLVSQSLRK